MKLYDELVARGLIAQVTDEEKVRILYSEIENPDNARYGTEGGNNTNDYVFALSYDELKTYFEKEKYFTYPTQYAIDEAVMVGYETSYAWWWLRSPGFMQDMVAVCATRDADANLVGEFGDNVDMLAAVFIKELTHRADIRLAGNEGCAGCNFAEAQLETNGHPP